MSTKKKNYSKFIFPALLFLLVYIFTGFHLANPDIYLHLIAGKVISQYGIIHYDVLSQLGAGREWLPMEWLFQVFLYKFISLFGLSSYKIFIGIFSAMQIIVFYCVLRRIINLNAVLSFCVSIFFALTVYPFLVARPQLIASIFFIAELYLLLTYVLKNKNYLYLLLPVFYLWGNMHASVILGLLLCFAYSLVSFLNYLTIKKTEWVKKTKILGIYGLALSLITVLPPQGFAQYQILWSFVKYRDLVTRVISEWVPLWNYAAPFALYSCFTAIILFIFIFVLVKKKMFKKTVWLYPLLVLIPYGYLAIRNMYYGYFALSILFGWILSQINFNSVKKSIKITFSLGFILLLVFLGRWMMQDDLNNKQDFPDHAADFIQEENIQGNMFNQFGYGSYLEYRLYPEHKALVDEKDFFVTLPDYYNLQSSLSASPGYAASFISFLQKYDISYAVLFVKNDPSGQIFSNILINNPNWSLVFWDDNTEIFIKKDGKNSDLITKFGTKSISPFGDSPSKVGLEKQAYDEYVRMVKTQDSALSRTIMGYLLQKQGALSQAEEEFQKAIQLNNSYVSAYISLAMLRANQGQVQSAIDLFEKALKINPNQTEVYMYLGNLYESIHDTQSELDILNQGASHASDENQIQYFQQKIQTLSK